MTGSKKNRVDAKTDDGSHFKTQPLKPRLTLDPDVARRAQGSMVEHSGTRPLVGRSALDSDHNGGL